MSLTSNIIINTYSVLLLIFVCIQTVKERNKKTLQERLYFVILLSTILMLVLDILSRFEGSPGTIYPVINHIGNFLVFLFSPVISSFWLLYAYIQVFREGKKIKPLIYFLITVAAVNTVLLILTQFFGWYYYIDSGNIYHRGPLYFVSATFTGIFAFLAFALILVNRRQIDRKYFPTLLLFPVPPLICMLLQLIFYGTSLMLNGVSFSLFIVFVTVQNRSNNTDFLTGAYTRKRLELYMDEKISTSTDKSTFSAILIDLDNFKLINDNFGHDMGDHVLVDFVTLLKSCLGPLQFIARYGGDEFYIILDVSSQAALEAEVHRIENNIEKYNNRSGNPFRLSISIGYAVYDCSLQMSVEEFQKHIDVLMYEHKRSGKFV